jgi:hypothetical protein
MADPTLLQNSTPVEGVTDPKPQRDVDLPAYRYAQALTESARSAADQRISTFPRNWRFFRGQDHWGVPATTAAAKLDQWSFRGVVNWLYATVKTKSAMICSAPNEIFCDPMDDQSSYYDRLLVKSVIEHDLKRLRFNGVKEDAYLSGSVTGIGVTMVTVKPDPLTGAMATVFTPIKSTEFFRDPSADCITSPSCRFIVYSPELDMSTVKEMFPRKGQFVKPTIRQVGMAPSSVTYRYQTDENLVYGSAGEFVVDAQNMLRARKAIVNFVWIKDESVIEELQEILIKEAEIGLHCSVCGLTWEPGSIPELTSEAPCPQCGADLDEIEIPKKTQQDTIIRRKYPYGRLIVYSSDTLLFDGENPYEIETVFPFAVYHHDRIPGDFYGVNDVDLLESLQTAQNTTVGQLIDYVRLCVNGPFVYPVAFKSLTALGNTPGERHPGPDNAPWQPHYVIPEGFNVQAWSALTGSLSEHFQIVSGLAQLGLGQTSSPPISATEAEIANARLSDRMKGHAQAFSAYMSDVANLDWQLLQQFADSPMNVAVTMPDSSVKSIDIELDKLPKVRVKIEVNTSEAVKDKILGQNSVPIFTDPAMMTSPYLDIVLQAIGHSPNLIKELLVRRGVQQEIGPASGPPTQAAPPAPGLSLVPEGGISA